MNALKRRYDTGKALLEVRQLERQLAKTRDRTTMAKLIDRIDTLTARALAAERRPAFPHRPRKAPVARGGRRARCFRLVKR